MMVAVHQPNYAPWLGYFAKMTQCDVFVFLDDVQYSKNSYINRVQIDGGGAPRWLTVPVSYSFGDPINRVRAADAGWRRSHLDTLKTHYASAPQFGPMWRWLSDVYASLPDDDIAATNEALIRAVATELGLARRFCRASELGVGNAAGDDRLIAILRALAPGSTYLSGKGGSNYQDPAKFEAAGLKVDYVDFAHPTYDQGHEFLPGLSVLDALFRVGWERVAGFVSGAKGA